MSEKMNDWRKLWMKPKEYKYNLNILPGFDRKQAAALVEIADNLRIIASLLAEHEGYCPLNEDEVKHGSD